MAVAQALKQRLLHKPRVIRNGIINWLPADVLVPGDIVLLEAGNAIPADLRITESVNLKIDEAALTGESHPIDKIIKRIDTDNLPVADQKNMAFRGTFVTYGRGSGVVTVTGMQTELGRIAKMLQGEKMSTPLQERMTSFGKKLSVMYCFYVLYFLLPGG